MTTVVDDEPLQVVVVQCDEHHYGLYALPCTPVSRPNFLGDAALVNVKECALIILVFGVLAAEHEEEQTILQDALVEHDAHAVVQQGKNSGPSGRPQTTPLNELEADGEQLDREGTNRGRGEENARKEEARRNGCEAGCRVRPRGIAHVLKKVIVKYHWVHGRHELQRRERAQLWQSQARKLHHRVERPKLGRRECENDEAVQNVSEVPNDV
mmetsp:Transcript_31957/g.88308  ORF Transcript_31957/g.88308 Transcript_31957/m.88308 type:complete len:212 (-) Transcript_31957:95-730(-)